MWDNILCSYPTTKIAKKKVIWGKDEIPLTTLNSTQWSIVY